MLPPLAVTVIGKVPAGVALLVLIVNTVVQSGLQLEEEKDADAPPGNPEAEKETGCEFPETMLALMEFVIDAPPLTDLLPEFANEKLKGWASPTVIVSRVGGEGTCALSGAVAITCARIIQKTADTV